MTWNKVHHISLHKPISFDMLSLVAWLDSLTTKHRHKGQTELQLWIPLRFYPCSSRTECIMVATLHLWLIDLPMLHLLLCLFSLKGAHPFDEHFLCAAEKIAISLFLLSLPPPFPNHSISLTYRSLSIILTLSLSPLLFSNLVSIRMLNLERNDTYGVTKGKSGGGKKGLRPEIEWRQAAD